jgi:hypothetical protein
MGGRLCALPASTHLPRGLAAVQMAPADYGEAKEAEVKESRSLASIPLAILGSAAHSPTPGHLVWTEGCRHAPAATIYLSRGCMAGQMAPADCGGANQAPGFLVWAGGGRRTPSATIYLPKGPARARPFGLGPAVSATRLSHPHSSLHSHSHRDSLQVFLVPLQGPRAQS